MPAFESSTLVAEARVYGFIGASRAGRYGKAASTIEFAYGIPKDVASARIEEYLRRYADAGKEEREELDFRSIVYPETNE